MLHRFLRICWIAAMWAFAWGITGAMIGAVITIFQPDTGHIPSNMVPIMVGVPSAAVGLGAGLLYGTLAVAFGMEVRLGKRGRTILGAAVGCAAGVVFMRVLAHSYLTVVVTVLLGVFLATVFLPGKSPAAKK